MIVALHHVQLAIPRDGEDRARDFWAGTLGMEEVPKPEALAARGGCWFRSGAFELHLGVEEPFSPARKAHPGIVVADLDAVVAALEAAGVEVTPDGDLPGHARVHAHDPFGNRLEFVRPRQPAGLPTTLTTGTGSDLVLRRATTHDLPTVLGLMAAGQPPDAADAAESADPEVTPRDPTATEAAAFAAITTDPRLDVLVVVDGARVVATMQVLELPHVNRAGRSRLQLESVHVAPDHRGGGVGATMMGWAVDEARRRDCTLVQLTSNTARLAAHRFYERTGFTGSHIGFKHHLD